MEGSSLMENRVPHSMAALGVRELEDGRIEIPAQAHKDSGTYCMHDHGACPKQGEPFDMYLVQPGTGANYTALRHRCLSEKGCTEKCTLPRPE